MKKLFFSLMMILAMTAAVAQKSMSQIEAEKTAQMGMRQQIFMLSPDEIGTTQYAVEVGDTFLVYKAYDYSEDEMTYFLLKMCDKKKPQVFTDNKGLDADVAKITKKHGMTTTVSGAYFYVNIYEKSTGTFSTFIF